MQWPILQRDACPMHTWQDSARMKCARCQHENPPGQKFCGECGSALVISCYACSASNPPGQRFCGQCGAGLGEERPGPKSASPQSYTPQHLAERILTARSALEGERKHVTVLFADLKGSMELLSDRDPEEARTLIDPVLQRMMQAVHRYEGTVNQVMGDGIMSLFGAPLALEDHAVRACYAALAMQNAIRAYSEELRRARGVVVRVRVGIHSGEVLVRTISSDLQMDYSAVGQTTHLAARMEQLADPGTTFITEDTLRLVEGLVAVKPQGPVPVKGLAEAVEVFELTGVGGARSRLQAAVARGLTKFVGRNGELAQLNHALERVKAGHGEVVAMLGEPGVGKSRLVWEFTHAHRILGCRVLESGSVSYGKATSYLPVIDLLKGYLGIEGRDDERDIRAKVIGRVFELDRKLESTLPALFGLLDVPVDDDAWLGLEPAERRERTLDAVKRLLLRESQVQPLLLIFEDLHWIDSGTQALLDDLVESVPVGRILLVVNYRPEYQHSWGNKTYYTQLRLDALPAESANELLDTLLGADAELGPLRQLLLDRTEGNPFFLEESVRALVDTNVLVGVPGRYRLAQPDAAIQVPATVQGVLAARIDRLQLEDKGLLQAASVIGKDVPLLLLDAIADLPGDAVRRGLARLQSAEFLYQTNLFPELEYTFKHALTHEVAYSSLLLERRRALHARVVAAIERVYAERLSEHVERLAQHAVRGQIWEKALLCLHQAGTKALDRSAIRQAVEYFDQALAVVKRLPNTRQTLEQAVDIRFQLRSALHILGELERVAECLREAETLAEALGDQRRAGLALGFLAFNFTLIGDHDRAIEASQRALEIAQATNDLGVKVVGTNYLGLAHFYLGNYSTAIAAHDKNVELLDGDLMKRRFGLPAYPAVLARSYLAWSLAELGGFAQGSVRGVEAVRLAAELEHSFTSIWAHFSAGYLNLRQGDMHAAVASLEQASALCRQTTNVPFVFPLVASLLGCAYLRSGRRSEALPVLEKALQAGTSMRLELFRPLLLGFLSEAHLLAKRMEEASKHAEQALLLSRQRKERGWEAWILKLVGDIASHPDSRDCSRGEESYLGALALASDLGMRPLIAHCHLGLARLYEQTEQRDQSTMELENAMALYREMDMRF